MDSALTPLSSTLTVTRLCSQLCMAGPMVSGSVFQEELGRVLQLLRMGREWVEGGVRRERERTSRWGGFILCFSCDCDWTCYTETVVITAGRI